MANEQNLKNFTNGNKAAVGYGRPKGSKSMSTVMRKMLYESTWPSNDGKGKPTAEVACLAILEKAIGGDVSAFREVRDTADGKPMQHTQDHTKPDLSKLNLSPLSDEQIEALWEINKDDT